MKKNDTLHANTLKPKKQTVAFLLNFSKSIAVIRTRFKTQVVSKN